MYTRSYQIEIQWVMYGDVALEGDGHRHKDGGRQDDLAHGIQEVGEKESVHLGAQAEALPQTLQDGEQEEEEVNDGQGHEQNVEGILHGRSGKERKRLLVN